MTHFTDRREREQIDITCQRGRLPWSIHLDSFSMMSNCEKIKSALQSLRRNGLLLSQQLSSCCVLFVALLGLMVGFTAFFFFFFTHQSHSSACCTFVVHFIPREKKNSHLKNASLQRAAIVYAWRVRNKLSASGVTRQSQWPCIQLVFSNPLCLASALRWLIHTYVSLMRQGQRLLGWNVSVLLRGKERISAFLNVKPLWLKKHATYYACICNLGRGCYCCR